MTREAIQAKIDELTEVLARMGERQYVDRQRVLVMIADLRKRQEAMSDD